MKLKYYLRGIGIGIILTAIVMGFALGGRKATMSDAEVIERAKALGMTEGGVLTSASSEEGSTYDTEDYSSSDQSVDEASEEASEEINEELLASSEASSELGASTEEAGSETSESESASEEVSKSEDESAKDAETGSEENDNTDSEGKESKEASSEEASVIETTTSGLSKTVTIPGGNSSDSVAQILYNAGVIDDPYSFNRYLIDRGLDRVIRSGTKTFPAGATYEDVAGIITR